MNEKLLCPGCGRGHGREGTECSTCGHVFTSEPDPPVDPVEEAWEQLRAAQARMAERRREEAERE